MRIEYRSTWKDYEGLVARSQGWPQLWAWTAVFFSLAFCAALILESGVLIGGLLLCNLVAPHFFMHNYKRRIRKSAHEVYGERGWVPYVIDITPDSLSVHYNGILWCYPWHLVETVETIKVKEEADTIRFSTWAGFIVLVSRHAFRDEAEVECFIETARKLIADAEPPPKPPNPPAERF